VEWQLRVAGGEPLPCAQEDLAITGHAFEARLYAEDVPAGFLPATGTLAHLSFPAGVRADSGVRAGDTISPWYDPMIAKLIVHGPNRATALAKLRRALAGTRVAGTVTNLQFLGALAAHEDFAAGDVDTGLIARDIGPLTVAPEPSPLAWIAAGMAALGLEAPARHAGFALWQPTVWSATITHGEETRRLSVALDGADRQRWQVAGETFDLARRAGAWRCADVPLPETHFDGRSVTVFEAHGLVFVLPDPLARGAETGAGSDMILAPMPGLVKSVFVEAGAEVARGARLAVLEAMKMEHVLTASRDGRVASVCVEAGAQVEAGLALITFEPEEDTA
jgi:3-methylcrotonyl-CoA carboxylase alpha subunit